MTALHLAARFSSASVIEAFVKAGANVNDRKDRQKTPLHYAAQFNTSEDVIRVLIECGADVSACEMSWHEFALGLCSLKTTN